MSDKESKGYMDLVFKILDFLKSVVPAALMYLLNTSKNKKDGLEAELSNTKMELHVEKEKEKIEDAASSKSSVDIVDDFIYERGAD